MKNSIEEILKYFPQEISNRICKYKNELETLEEIRVRANRNIILKSEEGECKISCVVSTKEILEILQRICDNSIYTYQNQICNGFITIKGRT